MNEYTYEQIQTLRETLLEEIKKTVTNINIEHLKLIEMRVQTVIMAGLLGKDVKNQVSFSIDAVEEKKQ